MTSNDKLIQLQDFLETEIPLLAHMQLKIDQPVPGQLQITAPIGPNSNHHKTAFGGSIATLGIACGWAWTYLRLLEEDLPCMLVIQKNSVEYLAPVHSDFTAECGLEDENLWQQFLTQLNENGRARIELQVRTRCQEKLVAHHSATYAAIRE